MPARLTVEIEPRVLHEGGLPAHTGPAVYYAILDAIRSVDDTLAKELHDERPKRLVATPVLDGAGNVVVGPNRASSQFQVGVLDDALVGVFLGAITAGQILRIGRHSTVTVTSVTTSGHPSYRDIHAAASPDTAIDLRFLTPTTFRTGAGQGARRGRPFPVPELVFTGLATRWNQFAIDAVLDLESVAEVVFEHLELASFDLRTATHLTKADPPKVFETGFVGTVHYKVCMPEGLDDHALRAVSALATFATFAGVGDKTNMGMGIVAREDGEARDSIRRPPPGGRALGARPGGRPLPDPPAG